MTISEDHDELFDFSEDDLTLPSGMKRWSDPPAPGVTVRQGERKRLFAGSELHLEFFKIERGGELIIQGGRRRFTHIRLRDFFENNGIVRVGGFRSSGGTFSELAPDGEDLEAFLEEVNRGGDGGNGSTMRCSFGGSGSVGRGARGTPDYGGGGGSGVGWDKSPRGRCVPGEDADDWRGAQSKARHPGGDGGDGARRGRAINGGYLYIRSDGWFSSPGLMNFTGSKGAAGKSGFRAAALGTGGGGGGAPGGQGGFLYVKCSEIRGDINFDASGGTGGEPGEGATAYGNRANDGMPGENGFDGAILVL